MLLILWIFNNIVTSDCRETTAKHYPGCGVKIGFKIKSLIYEGIKAEENVYPWTVFLYKLGSTVGDLPEACTSPQAPSEHGL